MNRFPARDSPPFAPTTSPLTKSLPQTFLTRIAISLATVLTKPFFRHAGREQRTRPVAGIVNRWYECSEPVTIARLGKATKIDGESVHRSTWSVAD